MAVLIDVTKLTQGPAISPQSPVIKRANQCILTELTTIAPPAPANPPSQFWS